jgi:hypothetical protein
MQKSAERLIILSSNIVNTKHKLTLANFAGTAATIVVALCGSVFINGCALLGPQSPPAPPPPAIINTSKTEEDKLQRENNEKDAKIAELSSQIDRLKDQIATMKEQKEFSAATPAVPDDGNASPVSTAPAATDDGSTPAAGDDSSDAGSDAITVWVSSSSNQYFLPGSRFYGKGQGQYMTEDQATNDGYKRSNHR